MRKTFIYMAVFGALFLSNCSNSEEGSSLEESLEDDMVAEVNKQTEEQLKNQEMLNDLIVSMPSPLETSFAIKSSGAEYNSEFLNPIQNIEKYSSESKKAMNMGVYGTDLGYINIYEKQLHVVSYMTCLKTLAEDLNVGHFFDLEAVAKMTSNANNMDSLILESTRSYNEMDNFLREQNREKLSVLMAIGAWSEGMNILIDVFKQTNDVELRNKIIEQGIVVETISSLINIYSDDEYFKPIVPLMGNIELAYAKVQTNEVEGETQMVEVDGELQIIETGYTEYSISDGDFDVIIQNIGQLRSLIIQ